MPTGLLINSPEFGNGNVFNSGKAAMALTQTWYTCCLDHFSTSGTEFQVGIIPLSADGLVHGRIDADTFRIWKGSQHPEATFNAMIYLITTGGDQLLPAYGAVPAISSKADSFFKKMGETYPFVASESWEVFATNATHLERLSLEGYGLPLSNYDHVLSRIQAFGNLMDQTPPNQFDFEAEFRKLEDDLTAIFNFQQ